jgi:ferrous iron transport protein B
VSRHLIAIAGNPNTGKTTLFNALTGSRAKVGNYPGITVDRRIGRARVGALRHVDILDIPGTYSLVARSADEQIALEAMLGLRGQPRPEAVVFCVDATQLVRSLYLVLQAQELGAQCVVALTMMDEAGQAAPDPAALAQVLGCPVVPVVARKGIGLNDLARAVADRLEQAEEIEPLWRWQPSAELQRQLAGVRPVLPESWPQSDAMALWALMSVGDDDQLSDVPAELRAAVDREHATGTAVDDEVTGARYRWLDQHVAPLVRGPVDRSLTDRIDRLLLHRVSGFALFLLVMFVVFQSLFAWADPAISAIEMVFGWLGERAAELLPAGLFADFIVNGVIAGMGSVVVFLPQILLLFFFIGLMEDTGYMARVAYLMDRIMKSMKLPGRAFVPMLSGFACAVPAILSTRTMERRRDRLLTMLVVPLMTCSARLPIYTLIIGSLFPAEHVLGVFPIQGLLMVGMYVFSTVAALTAAWVLSRTLKPLRARGLPMVIELPPYRLPRLGDVTRMMWERTGQFVREAGTVILACTIALWALLSFPRPAEVPAGDSAVPVLVAPDDAEAGEQARQSERMQGSYGARLGRAMEPVIEPLGFDWKIGVGIIGAFAAREVFISTMGVLYSIGGDVDETSTTLRQRMREQRRNDGSPVYTPLVGLSLLVFFALACQCMSTLAVVRRETGGYRWPLFMFLYMTALAWGASFVVYQGGRLLAG